MKHLVPVVKQPCHFRTAPLRSRHGHAFGPLPYGRGSVTPSDRSLTVAARSRLRTAPLRSRLGHAFGPLPYGRGSVAPSERSVTVAARSRLRTAAGRPRRGHAFGPLPLGHAFGAATVRECLNWLFHDRALGFQPELSGHPRTHDRGPFGGEPMLAGDQVELDVAGMGGQPPWKFLHLFVGVKLVLIARDMQYRSRHRLVFRLLPIPRNTAA